MTRILTLLLAAMLVAGCANRPPTVSPGQPHGMVLTEAGERADRTYPVHVIAINGVNIPRERDAVFWIRPGTHVFRVVPLIQTPAGVLPLRGPGPDQREIAIDVEQGRRYVLGARVHGPRLSEWEPVILRVEEIRG
jgi:hypothetical protein